MEAVDPSVPVAVYAAAVWIVGRVRFLGEITNPEADKTALSRELRTIKKGRQAHERWSRTAIR